MTERFHLSPEGCFRMAGAPGSISGPAHSCLRAQGRHEPRRDGRGRGRSLAQVPSAFTSLRKGAFCVEGSPDDGLPVHRPRPPAAARSAHSGALPRRPPGASLGSAAMAAHALGPSAPRPRSGPGSDGARPADPPRGVMGERVCRAALAGSCGSGRPAEACGCAPIPGKAPCAPTAPRRADSTPVLACCRGSGAVVRVAPTCMPARDPCPEGAVAPSDGNRARVRVRVLLVREPGRRAPCGVLRRPEARRPGVCAKHSAAGPRWLARVPPPSGVARVGLLRARHAGPAC